jgi:predicted transposase/invertase (TIGR01784 family)
MPKKITHFHDRGYKRLFSNINFFKQLMLCFVDQPWVKKLDFEHCEKLNKSFVSAQYRETTSDLIYKVKLLDGSQAYICILLEFQSSVQRFMIIRLLNYVSNFYLDLIEAGTKDLNKLPPIFPIVLYNGKDKWTAPTTLSEQIIDQYQLLGDFAPAFRYFPIIINNTDPEELTELNNLVSTLFLAEAHYDLDKLKTAFFKLFDKEQHEDILLLIDWFFHLVEADRHSVGDYDQLLQTCQTTAEAKLMLEDALERERAKYEARGKAEGEAIGMLKAKQEIAKNLLLAHVEIQLIANVTGLSEAEVGRLQAELKPH